jgi:hypothetical protein
LSLSGRRWYPRKARKSSRFSLNSQEPDPVETGAESNDPRYNSVMSPLRIVGFVLIAAAVLFAIASIWYSVLGISSGLSLYDVCYKFLPAGLNWLQRYLWAGLWNGIYIILIQPAWMVVGIIGLLCVGLGRRRVE